MIDRSGGGSTRRSFQASRQFEIRDCNNPVGVYVLSMRTILLSFMVLMFGVSQALCACPPDGGSDTHIARTVDHHAGNSADHHSDEEHACDGCQHCASTDLYAVPQIDKVEATPRIETKNAAIRETVAAPRFPHAQSPPAPPIDVRWRARANSPISRHDISLT